jgi:hypothetical protein
VISSLKAGYSARCLALLTMGFLGLAVVTACWVGIGIVRRDLPQHRKEHRHQR